MNKKLIAVLIAVATISAITINNKTFAGNTITENKEKRKIRRITRKKTTEERNEQLRLRQERREKAAAKHDVIEDYSSNYYGGATTIRSKQNRN